MFRGMAKDLPFVCCCDRAATRAVVLCRSFVRTVIVRLNRGRQSRNREWKDYGDSVIHIDSAASHVCINVIK